MRSISGGGRTRLAMIAVAVSVGLAACDNTVDDTGITPPTQPTTTVTDTFTGSINVNGAATHTFAVSFGGAVAATLTTIAPEGTVAGLSLGTWNGAVCAIALAKDDAIQGNTVTATASSPGTLCVRIQDTGKITAATVYTISVVHY